MNTNINEVIYGDRRKQLCRHRTLYKAVTIAYTVCKKTPFLLS